MRSNGNKTILNPKGYTKDIVKSVVDVFKKTHSQAAEFTPIFNGGSVREICENIVCFILDNIKYKVDPVGEQWIKTPFRFIDDGVGDCKSYSIFVCSVLTELGIENGFRFASYSNGDFTHVYSVAFDEVGNEIVVDCVAIQQHKAGLFEEVKYKKQKTIMNNTTKISMLSGVSETEEIKEIVFSANDTMAQITAKCFLYATIGTKQMLNTGLFLQWITDTYKSKQDLEICAYVFQMYFDGAPGLVTMKSYCKQFVEDKANPNSPYQVSKIQINEPEVFEWFNKNIVGYYNLTYKKDCAAVANEIIKCAELGLYLFVEDKYLNKTQILKKNNQKVFFESLIANTGISWVACKCLLYGAIKQKYNCTPNKLLSILFDSDFGQFSYTDFISGVVSVYDSTQDPNATGINKNKVWNNIGDIAKGVQKIFTDIFGIVKGGTNNITPYYTDVTTGSGSMVGIAVVGLVVLGGAFLLKNKKKRK